MPIVLKNLEPRELVSALLLRQWMEEYNKGNCNSLHIVNRSLYARVLKFARWQTRLTYRELLRVLTVIGKTYEAFNASTSLYMKDDDFVARIVAKYEDLKATQSLGERLMSSTDRRNLRARRIALLQRPKKPSQTNQTNQSQKGDWFHG
jgi:hypothetical protein